MKPTAIWSPDDQDVIFDSLSQHNKLRTRPRALAPWPGPSRIDLFERVPILYFHCGQVELRWTGWTRGRFGTSPAAIDARDISIGRRCLVPAAGLELEGDRGAVEIIAVDRPFMLIGAVWRPQNEYAHEPDRISLLSTAPPVDWATELQDAPTG